MNWDEYRRTDGSIDLIKAFDEEHKTENFNKAISKNFLELMQIYQPIKSRQVAALALAQAYYIGIKE
jgi:hypothetical protein